MISPLGLYVPLKLLRMECWIMDASFTNIGIELKNKNSQASHLSGEGGVGSSVRGAIYGDGVCWTVILIGVLYLPIMYYVR